MYKLVQGDELNHNIRNIFKKHEGQMGFEWKRSTLKTTTKTKDIWNFERYFFTVPKTQILRNTKDIWISEAVARSQVIV